MREVFGYKVPDNVFKHMNRDNLACDRFTRMAVRMQGEYARMKEWIPVDAHASLDIGCGLGAIDIELANRSGLGILHLLDGDGTGQRENGLKPAHKPWGDVTFGYDFVLANVNKGVAVKSHVPWFPFRDAVDVIVSLTSWGHHYPMETYLDLAQRALSKGGRIIVDIRNGTNGVETLTSGGFKQIGQCNETPKCKRFVFEKV